MTKVDIEQLAVKLDVAFISEIEEALIKVYNQAVDDCVDSYADSLEGAVNEINAILKNKIT